MNMSRIKEYLLSHRFTRLLCDGIYSCIHFGIRYTWQKVKFKISSLIRLRRHAKKVLFTPKQLRKQRKTVFEKEIQFSILVPLYNTPRKFLEEMIQSVLDQTYGNWELCMADGSDGEHNDVGTICRSYAEKDHRIQYNRLDGNYGISGNTNACIRMSHGDYLALFDHDDLLHPAALFEVMQAITSQNADLIYTDENTFHKKPSDAYCPHHKPDYAPDTLRSNNYICHFTVFSRALLQVAGGGFRSQYDGSQDYDMILRLTEHAKKIVHIPEILYYWRSHSNSVASDISAKPYVITAAQNAVADHMKRVGLKGRVVNSRILSTYQIIYDLSSAPLVSILIPSSDHVEDLKKCISSIISKSTYANWEIIVIENNSTCPETFLYYKELKQDDRIHVVFWDGIFNYSAINNFGAQYAKGEHLILLNNDTEVITPDWIEQMLMFSQREDIGAVGVKLLYPDNTIQHAGVAYGIMGLAGHLHRNFPADHPGYMGRLTFAQNVSCVTAACVMIRRSVWDQVGGLDTELQVAFNDIDLCMRIRKAGFLIVWTPYAELTHYESKSRGTDDTPEKEKRFQREVGFFRERWKTELMLGDPYYNPNFTMEREDYSIQ